MNTRGILSGLLEDLGEACHDLSRLKEEPEASEEEILLAKQRVTAARGNLATAHLLTEILGDLRGLDSGESDDVVPVLPN